MLLSTDFVPHNSTQARSLPDSAKWLAAGDKVGITCTTLSLSKGLIAILHHNVSLRIETDCP